MKEIVITLNDQGGGVMSWNTNELANTLRAQMASHPPVVVVKEKSMEDKTYYLDVGFFNTLEDVGGAMLSRQYKDPPCINDTVVRRLTPKECERLQGFPDHWTDIGEWVDSKGKKHKEADSPRYKALGNSIALPFWEWMAKRMVKQLGKENPTMGSLFSGIGGFELCYARAGAEPVWESEIEEFCIAVSKKHFGDSETGEKGDYEQYL